MKKIRPTKKKSTIPEHIWRLAERDQLRREVLRLKAIGVIKDKTQ